MSGHDHNRAFVRPLVQAVQEHGGAFAEILAHRAKDDPNLAAHLMAALDAVQIAFPEAFNDAQPRPLVVYFRQLPAVRSEGSV